MADQLVVGDRTYTKRHFQNGCHGWVRDVEPYRGVPGSEHRAEVGQEMLFLLNRIEELTVPPEV